MELEESNLIYVFGLLLAFLGIFYLGHFMLKKQGILGAKESMKSSPRADFVHDDFAGSLLANEEIVNNET